MGLIQKRQTSSKGVVTNYYKAILPYPTKISAEKEPPAETAEGGTAETAEGHCQNGRGGTAETAEEPPAETADNNNINNNINNIIYNLLVKTE